MSMDLNREQKRHLKRMGALDDQGNPARQRPVPQARKERVGIRQYLSEVRDELRKVAWPKWPEVRRYSIVVLITVVLLTAYIGVLDTAFAFVTDWLYET